MKTFALALLVACAPTAMTTNAQHPANPDAASGRLAGPPAALRPGVADLSKPTPTTTDHSSHGASDAASEHAGHGEQPAAPQTPPAKPEPEPAKSDEPKSEPAKKPVEKPRKQAKRPASKKAPAETSTDTPKQPPPSAHQGHEGHH